jgi:hypothetical protein
METFIHDDTVMTSWRRLTDNAKALWRKRVDDAFAVAPRGLPQAACGAIALENLPADPAAMPHAGLMTLRGGAASSSLPAQAATATARCRADRYGEAIQQAAQLASWEDEGGTTSS